jgi:hypothetical protein|tara:strand:- start:1795 stop:2070 length:276 start_codon:yes stop_codon:yes gene_type:complete
MSKLKIKYPLIMIGWADAISNENGWHTTEEAIEWVESDNWIVHQVGWVIKETKDYVFIANVYNEASGGREETWSGLFKIPKPWIQYRKKIK